MTRYDRQTRLPFVGTSGQARVADARVLVVGIGALGGVTADYLARAGVGFLRLVDRDLVEATNLQRQTLFDESSVGEPKAVAAATRIRAVNSAIQIDPVVADVDPANVASLAAGIHLIIDGTDNAQTRYLLNDVAVKAGVPWVYGGCVGTDGRVAAIRPGVTPCLRCLYPHPPAAGELATCDTAGVLGPAAGVVASLQAVAAVKLLLGVDVAPGWTTLDFWADRYTTIDPGDRDPACPCCGLGRFEFLDRPIGPSAVLCGRDAVQVMPSNAASPPDSLAARLSAAGTVVRTPHLLRFSPTDPPGITLTVFRDGRTIVAGTTDPARARSLVDRFIGR